MDFDGSKLVGKAVYHRGNFGSAPFAGIVERFEDGWGWVRGEDGKLRPYPAGMFIKGTPGGFDVKG